MLLGGLVELHWVLVGYGGLFGDVGWSFEVSGQHAGHPKWRSWRMRSTSIPCAAKHSSILEES